MAQNLSNFDAALREDYLPVIREQLNNQTYLMTKLRRNERDVYGKDWKGVAHYGRNSGVGGGSETGLPTAGQQAYKNPYGTVKYTRGRIQVSGPVMAASRGDKGAIVRALDSEMKGVTKDLAKEVNYMMFNDGTSRRCLVNGDPGTGTTLTVDSPGTNYLYDGMVITIVGDDDGVANDATATISTVDSSTQVTVSAALDTNIEDDDWVIRYGSHDGAGILPSDSYEMMGLKGKHIAPIRGNGFCECGCGQKTRIADKTVKRNGWIKGQPLRFIHGHNRRKLVRTPQRERHTAQYIEWRLSVFARDNYTCQLCGYAGKKLEAHHIYKFKKFPKKRFIVKNGITLCKECHYLTRGKEKLFRKHFIALIEKRMNSGKVLRDNPEPSRRGNFAEGAQTSRRALDAKILTELKATYIACDNCGKTIRLPYWKRKTNKNNFCSLSCKHQWQKDNFPSGKDHPQFSSVKKHCSYCGKEIYMIPARAKITKKFFCNKEHYALYRRYGSNPTTSVLPERDDIVGAIQQCIDV